MRFAILAMAAVSGLLLMGLAFYGQPAMYIHQAREKWAMLVDGSTADPSIEPDRDASNPDDVARLQEQVSRLETELAARQAAAANAGSPATASTENPSAAPIHPPTDASAGPVQPNAAAGRSADIFSQAAPSEGQLPTPPVQPVVPPADNQTLASSAQSMTPPVEAPDQAVQTIAPPLPRPVPPTQLATRQDEPVLQASPDVVAPKMEHAAPRATGVEPAAPPAATPDHRDTSASKPARSAPEAAPRPSKRSTPAPEPAAALPEPPKAAPPKAVAVNKPPPAPPPLPSRQETDDARAVLARLRQAAPAPVQQAEVSPPAEPRARPTTPFPSLPKLTAARAALASGRIDNARRLLQEAQLQLVFRPIGGAGDDLPSVGDSAANVAHALEALSANDVPLSRRYVDVAIDDLAGSGTSTPVQESQVRATGYAPAYPPR